MHTVDPSVDLMAAVCKKALDDYYKGPSVCGMRHYDSACRFLEAAGLMQEIQRRYASAGCGRTVSKEGRAGGCSRQLAPDLQALARGVPSSAVAPGRNDGRA